MVSNNSSSYSWLEKSLHTIHKANWYRSVKAISGLSGTVVELAGRKEVVNFC